MNTPPKTEISTEEISTEFESAGNESCLSGVKEALEVCELLGSMALATVIVFSPVIASTYVVIKYAPTLPILIAPLSIAGGVIISILADDDGPFLANSLVGCCVGVGLVLANIAYISMAADAAPVVTPDIALATKNAITTSAHQAFAPIASLVATAASPVRDMGSRVVAFAQNALRYT